MGSVFLKTPARLHFGLIDMNGEIGRIDGGIGLALDSPQTLIEADQLDRVNVVCKEEPELGDRIQEAVRTVCAYLDFPGAYVNVRERPLQHVGMGSATQILVGVAQAVCEAYGVVKTAQELAVLVGRGGTSGIGVGAVNSGGFIMDGGHPFRRGHTSKQGYMPSGASADVTPPPILFRHDFPDWDILITVPMGEGISGLREVTLFRVICPLPKDEVQQMCHILLMQMLPAVIESDLESFGSAMEDFQDLGFKIFEFRAQTQLVLDCLQFLKDEGGIGVGMSSWGPALFAFGEDLSGLKEKADGWLAGHGGGTTILTRANNVGAQLVDPVA